ncbi:MAG: hypothetical protein QOD12_667 [Verrucomicrobiota bacterium]
MLLKAARLSLFLAVGAGSLLAKEPQQLRETTFIGAVGCKSSSCHGGAGPKRSQYITWSQHDYHTKAFPVLLNARSARIAEGLGITEAQTSARCTVCHSPLQSVAPSRLAAAVRPDEGVSCESCHGAAGGWLRGHTRTDWTYNTRVSAGMRDLRSLYVRANACVACHQNVPADVLKAGHPELFFELDGQSIAEPKHWRDDEEPWSGLREWLTGQAVALREISWALVTEPGDDLANARWNGVAWLCATAAATNGAWPQMSPPVSAPGIADFTQAQKEADVLARKAAVSNWSENAARTLLGRLASTDEEFGAKGVANPVLAQRAKRLVLALDRLTNALNPNRSGARKASAELNQLFADVKFLDAFDASVFAAHLKAFHSAVE